MLLSIGGGGDGVLNQLHRLESATNPREPPQRRSASTGLGAAATRQASDCSQANQADEGGCGLWNWRTRRAKMGLPNEVGEWEIVLLEIVLPHGKVTRIDPPVAVAIGHQFGQTKGLLPQLIIVLVNYIITGVVARDALGGVAEG